VVWTVSGVERVPGSHIVHFILDAVAQLPITDFRVNDRGTGSEQYDLKRLFTLKTLAAAGQAPPSRSSARSGSVAAASRKDLSRAIAWSTRRRASVRSPRRQA
jgi:hypothetical protein